MDREVMGFMGYVHIRISVVPCHLCGMVILGLFFSLMGVGLVQGQAFVGPIAQGVGGAGRAAVEVGESVLLNPASLVHSSKYSVGTYYLNGVMNENVSQKTFGVIITDNHEGVAFPGAVAYFQGHREFADFPNVKERVVQVSLSHFVYRRLALGASAHYVNQKEEKGRSYTQWNGTLGLHWNPSSQLGLGLVCYHLLNTDKIPSHLRLSPAWGLGFIYVFSDFLKFKLDTTLPLSNNPRRHFTFHGGMESSLSRYLTFRMGGEINNITRNNNYALGMTFDALRWLFDYSIKIYPRSKDTMHGVDLRVAL